MSATDELAANSTLQSVLRLSSDDEAIQREACQALMSQLQLGEVTAGQLLQLDCLPPLVYIVQSAPVGPNRSSSAAGVAVAVSAPTPSVSTLARRVLHQLQLESQLRLFDAGWSVSSDRDTGRVTYRNAGTKEERAVPPVTSAVADETNAGEPEWVHTLLLELPLLCSPLRRSDGSEEWAARVRSHRPRSLSGSTAALSVIDVRPDTEGVAGGEAAEGVSRQLIVGQWQGIGCSFRETETDLSYAPGTHLEAFYTVTMGGLALLAAAAAQNTHAATSAAAAAPAAPAAASSSPPLRVLVLGLGGGALVSFLAQYAPHCTLDVVELNPAVAATAERWFGVRFTHSLIQQRDGAAADAAGPTPLSLAVESGFAAPFAGAPCALYVCDAAEYARSAAAASYDLVLLDVYTSAVFPPSLLTASFFGDLRRILAPHAGALIVNAGVGADREAVGRCAAQAFGDTQCRFMMDRKAAAAAAAAASASASTAAGSLISAPATAASSSTDAVDESCVLLAGYAAARFRSEFNVLAWRKRVTERHPSDLQPLPFELHAMSSSDAAADEAPAAAASTASDDAPPLQLPHTLISWRGVQLDKLDARRQRQAEREHMQTAIKTATKMASKDDAAWSLFD